MRRYGLIGRNIEYSFSRSYFKNKFENEQLPFTYENFDIENIEELKTILKKEEGLRGLNVTIPYKEEVIPYLDKLNKTARKIGAVNTIKFTNKYSNSTRFDIEFGKFPSNEFDCPSTRSQLKYSSSSFVINPTDSGISPDRRLLLKSSILNSIRFPMHAGI